MLESDKQTDEIDVGRSCDKRESTIETKEDREPKDTQVQLESNFETFKDDGATLKKDEILATETTKNPTAKKNNRKRKCHEIVTNERRQTRQSTGILIPNRYQYETSSRAKKARTYVKFQSNAEESKLLAQKFEGDTKEGAKENNYGNVIRGKQMLSLETSNDHDTTKHGLPMTRSKNNETSKMPIISNVRSCYGDSNVSRSTESNVSSKASNVVSQAREQYSAENNTQLGGTKKATSKHIPIQAMPLYNKERVTQVKCKSNNSCKSENELEKAIRIYSADAKSHENIIKDEDISQNSIVCKKSMNYDYYSEASNLSIDSEKTWSNIGSMPATPTHDAWSDIRPKESGNYEEDVENTSFRVFSAVKTNCKKPKSNDIFDVRHAEDDKNNNLKIQVSSNGGTNLNVKHSCTLGIDIGMPKHESSRAINEYSESVKDVSIGCTEHQITDPGLRASEGSEEETWSRHYQRPRSESTPKTNNSPTTRENKKASGLVGKKTAPKNSGRATSSSRKRKEQQAKPTNENNNKRGRPRKRDFPNCDRSTDENDTHLTKKVRSCKKKCENGPTSLGTDSSEPSEDTRGGHAITTAELHSLWQKFCQHGHFRVDRNFRPFNANTTDMRRDLSTRMYCYDPQHCMCTQNQYQNPNGNNGNNGVDASRSNFANRFETTNSTQSFSNDLIDLTTHSRYNANNAATSARPSPNTVNETFNKPRRNPLPSFNYNSMISQNPNFFSSYAQSSNGATSNHDHSFYNNNGNIHGNDIQSSGSSIPNATNSTNNHNAHMGMGRLSSGPNCANNSMFIHDNGQPSVSNMDYYNERNLLTNNSVNMMQNTVANNPNFNWGPSRSNLNIENVSMNQLNTAFLNGNSMNSAHMSGLSMNNENSVTDAHILMNSFMNTDFPKFPLPWYPGSTVYNPYVNNTPPYINNMHNAYNTFATFDHASFQFTNLAVRNATNNGLNPWISNILPTRNENSTINANSEMSVLCSISSHGTVGPTTLETNRDADTSVQNLDTVPSQNIMSVDGTLNVTNDNASTTYFTPHRTSAVMQDTETGNNYCSQESIDSYAQQSSTSHLVPFETTGRTDDICNQTSDITNDINNFLVVQDSINEKMKSCEQQENTLNYMPRRDSSPNREHANNKESEFSRLRQELADFTRQYADDSTRSMTRMFNADEIYSYVMGQEQDIERKSP